MAKPNSKWYKLDSAGTLYSALQKEEYSAIYRFSALMEKDVDPAALQRAIDRCMPRFPTFAVRIRKGAFWYYLEHNSAPGPFLKEDVSDPCQPVRFKEDNGWLVRFTITATAFRLRSSTRFPTAVGPSSSSARCWPNTCARPALISLRGTVCLI